MSKRIAPSLGSIVSFFFYYIGLRFQSASKLIIYILAVSLLGFMELVVAFIAQGALDSAIGIQSVSELKSFIWMYGFYLILFYLLTFYIRHQSAVKGITIPKKIKLNLMPSFLGSTMDCQNPNSMAHIIENDSVIAYQISIRFIEVVFRNSLILIIAVSLLFLKSPLLLVLLLLSTFIAVIPQYWVRQKIAGFEEEHRNIKVRSILFWQKLDRLKSLARLFPPFGWLRKSLNQLEEERIDIEISRYRLSRIESFTSNGVAILIKIIMVYLISMALVEKLITAGDVAFIGILCIKISGSFGVLAQFYRDIPSTQNIINRLSFLKRDDSTSSDHSLNNMKPISQISFQNLCIDYGSNSLNLFSKPLILNKGESIVFEAPNAGGKTSLFNLLTGFVHCQNSGVYIDGVKCEESLNNYIDGVGQHIEMFPVNLREHITLEKELDETLLNRSLEFACIKESESLYKLVKENTSWTSTHLTPGQQKRLHIARMFYQEREIWVFDELESGLSDVDFDKVIKKILGLDGKMVVFLTPASSLYRGKVLRIEALTSSMNSNT